MLTCGAGCDFVEWHDSQHLVNTWHTLQTILCTINHSDHEKSKIDITYSPHYAETIYISVHKDSFIPCFIWIIIVVTPLTCTSCWWGAQAGRSNVAWRPIITSDKCRNTLQTSLEHLSSQHTHTHISVYTHGSVPHRGRWGWQACSLWVHRGSPHAASHKGSQYHVPVKHTNTLSLTWWFTVSHLFM